MDFEYSASACSFGAEILTKHTTAIMNEAPGVIEAADIEYIHRMRVASRRFRAALPIFEACFPEAVTKRWSKDIRSITRALGAARDTDVQIDHLISFMEEHQEAKFQAGLRRMVLRLRQKREEMQTDVIQTITRIQEEEILPEMLKTLSAYLREHPPHDLTLFTLARNSIISRLDDLFIHDSALLDETNVEELHLTRIATKYLRYTLETFGPLYAGSLKQPIQVCRDIQETLGLIHDCDVWALLIPEFIQKERRRVEKFYGSTTPLLPLLPGIHCYEQARAIQRKEMYIKFLKQWTAYKQKGIWAGLVETIQTPLQA